eukprot:scaffold209303_cov28-Tisochrysis_lutea.AAC.1
MQLEEMRKELEAERDARAARDRAIKEMHTVGIGHLRTTQREAEEKLDACKRELELEREEGSRRASEAAAAQKKATERFEAFEARVEALYVELNRERQRYQALASSSSVHMQVMSSEVVGMEVIIAQQDDAISCAERVASSQRRRLESELAATRSRLDTLSKLEGAAQNLIELEARASAAVAEADSERKQRLGMSARMKELRAELLSAHAATAESRARASAAEELAEELRGASLSAEAMRDDAIHKCSQLENTIRKIEADARAAAAAAKEREKDVEQNAAFASDRIAGLETAARVASEREVELKTIAERANERVAELQVMVDQSEHRQAELAAATKCANDRWEQAMATSALNERSSLQRERELETALANLQARFDQQAAMQWASAPPWRSSGAPPHLPSPPSEADPTHVFPALEYQSQRVRDSSTAPCDNAELLSQVARGDIGMVLPANEVSVCVDLQSRAMRSSGYATSDDMIGVSRRVDQATSPEAPRRLRECSTLTSPVVLHSLGFSALVDNPSQTMPLGGLSYLQYRDEDGLAMNAGTLQTWLDDDGMQVLSRESFFCTDGLMREAAERQILGDELLDCEIRGASIRVLQASKQATRLHMCGALHRWRVGAERHRAFVRQKDERKQRHVIEKRANHAVMESDQWRQRALTSEEQLGELTQRAEHAEERAKNAEERAKHVEERAEHAEERAKHSEERAELAERSASTAAADRDAADLMVQELQRDAEVRSAEADDKLARLAARMEYLQSALAFEAERCHSLDGCLRVQRVALVVELEALEAEHQDKKALEVFLAAELDSTRLALSTAKSEIEERLQHTAATKESEQRALIALAAEKADRNAISGRLEQLHAEMLLSVAATMEAQGRANSLQEQLDEIRICLSSTEKDRDENGERAREFESTLRQVEEEVGIASDLAITREADLQMRVQKLQAELEATAAARTAVEVALHEEEEHVCEVGVSLRVLQAALHETVEAEASLSQTLHEVSALVALYRACVGDCDRELAAASLHSEENHSTVSSLQERLRQFVVDAARLAMEAAEMKRGIVMAQQRCAHAESAAEVAIGQLAASEALAARTRQEVDVLRQQLAIKVHEHEGIEQRRTTEREHLQRTLIEMQRTLAKEQELRSRAQDAATNGRDRERALEAELSRAQQEAREHLSSLKLAEAIAKESAIEADKQMHVLHAELQNSLMLRAELDTKLAEQQASHAAALRELEEGVSQQNEIHRRLVHQSTNAASRQLRHVLRAAWSPYATLAFHRWKANITAIACEEERQTSREKMMELERRSRMQLLQQARGFELRLQEIAMESARDSAA